MKHTFTSIERGRTTDRESELIDLLVEVSEFLDNYVDVVDGDYGEPRPNRAMQLQAAVEDYLIGMGADGK